MCPKEGELQISGGQRFLCASLCPEQHTDTHVDVCVCIHLVYVCTVYIDAYMAMHVVFYLNIKIPGWQSQKILKSGISVGASIMLFQLCVLGKKLALSFFISHL